MWTNPIKENLQGIPVPLLALLNYKRIKKLSFKPKKLQLPFWRKKSVVPSPFQNWHDYLVRKRSKLISSKRHSKLQYHDWLSYVTLIDANIHGPKKRDRRRSNSLHMRAVEKKWSIDDDGGECVSHTKRSRINSNPEIASGGCLPRHVVRWGPAA